ncbi:MAG: hypothetical protein F6J93_37015 [Oscillatoria sp. SIO1A7]|nr:hypothetical protein [Oscillatoria sp. SIO1A7]
MATAPRIINVLTVIDTETLLNKYQNETTTEATPATIEDSVAQATIHMIASTGDSINGSDSYELNVKGYVDDNVRWRAVSISENTVNKVEFYNFIKSNDNEPKVINQPEEIPSSTGNYWQATLIKEGTETYHWSFKIKDRSGKASVYLNWDPYITVKNP